MTIKPMIPENKSGNIPKSFFSVRKTLILKKIILIMQKKNFGVTKMEIMQISIKDLIKI
jgi:hypothetical protein